VVLAWFPLAHRRLNGRVQIVWRAIGSKFDVAYFAASTDSPEKNPKRCGIDRVNYPILSDPTKTAAPTASSVDHPSLNAGPSISGPTADLDIDTRVKASTHGADVAARLENARRPRS
jgi:hypothetical protein